LSNSLDIAVIISGHNFIAGHYNAAFLMTCSHSSLVRVRDNGLRFLSVFLQDLLNTPQNACLKFDPRSNYSAQRHTAPAQRVLSKAPVVRGWEVPPGQASCAHERKYGDNNSNQPFTSPAINMHYPYS